MKLMQCYMAVIHHLPKGTEIFSKTELNRYKQLPKNRPDMYIRTPDSQEAIVVIADDKLAYIIRKRLDEILAHSEDEGRSSGDYPRICFVLRDNSAKYSFLFAANKKLDGMGAEEDELHILATALPALIKDGSRIWSSAFKPKQLLDLFG